MAGSRAAHLRSELASGCDDQREQTCEWSVEFSLGTRALLLLHLSHRHLKGVCERLTFDRSVCVVHLKKTMQDRQPESKRFARACFGGATDVPPPVNGCWQHLQAIESSPRVRCCDEWIEAAVAQCKLSIGAPRAGSGEEYGSLLPRAA